MNPKWKSWIWRPKSISPRKTFETIQQKKKKKKAQINTTILKPQQLSQENHFIHRGLQRTIDPRLPKKKKTHTHNRSTQHRFCKMKKRECKKTKANFKPHTTDNSSYVIQTNQQKRERGSLHILHIEALPMLLVVNLRSARTRVVMRITRPSIWAVSLRSESSDICSLQ